MPDIGFLNGTFAPLEQVTISPDDRGFQFGDGVYEVVSVFDGHPFLLAEHLARLKFSAGEIRLALPYSPEAWREKLMEGVKRCGYRSCKVYIQVTRGVAPREHAFPSQATPTVLMTFREMVNLDSELQRTGVKAITVPDERWGRCDIKSLNLLPNVLAKQRAKEAGAFEAVFIRDGEVTEGTASNVMTVREGAIHTPPCDHRILAGVTRKILLEVAEKSGVSVFAHSMPVSELFEADEVFLVGTTITVLPVVEIDRRAIGGGKVGPVNQMLIAAYRKFMSDWREHSG